MSSNGTVIATGNPLGDNQRFCDLGTDLAIHLRKKLGHIFDTNYRRKFPNLWVTLGYFDCEDFMISDNIYEVFAKWQNLSLTCNIDRIHAVVYCKRTLENYKIYNEPLSLY